MPRAPLSQSAPRRHPKRKHSPPAGLLSHCDEWESCTRCPLHETATKHVLYRGTLPCDLLFIGEAPGECEDVAGQPFVGPAGKLLEQLLDATRSEIRRRSPHFAHFTYAITNILACAPWDEARGGRSAGKVRPPSQAEAAACSPRLHEFLFLAKPYGIVLLGKVAQKYVLAGLTEELAEAQIPVLELVHPAYLLRTGRHNSHEYAKCILQLAAFIPTVL